MARNKRRGPTRSRTRDKRREMQAKETQRSQRAAERRQISLRAYQFRRALGWSLVALGISVGVGHWLTHIQLWEFASQGVMDLVAGYPMAVLLAVAGTVVLSKA